MTNKELVTVEFRYYDKPKNEDSSGYKTETITIGIYDTLDEAMVEGNKILDTLSKRFQVRYRFVPNHLFGRPNRLVTNTCYPTNGIQYFAMITPLMFTNNLDAVIQETFDASCRSKAVSI